MNEELRQFFGGCFHQDWQLDDPTPDAVVERFVSNSSREDVSKIVTALKELCASEHSEATLRRLLTEDYLSYYLPPPTTPAKVWLLELLTFINTSMRFGGSENAPCSCDLHEVTQMRMNPLFSSTQFIFSGLDVLWFAVDKLGRVAHFTSAGNGPVPVNIKAADDITERLLNEVSKLPTTRSPQVVLDPSLKEFHFPWSAGARFKQYVREVTAMVQRGIFCSDAPQNPEYQRIALPENPLVITELEPALAALLSSVRLDCSFAEQEWLS